MTDRILLHDIRRRRTPRRRRRGARRRRSRSRSTSSSCGTCGEAGRTDDLARTVDYSVVDAIVRDVVANRSFKLLETIAETIAAGVLAAFPVDEVVVRVRKPAVRLAGPIDYSGVEIRRARGEAA